VNKKDKKFIDAIRHGNMKRVVNMLKRGQDVNIKDDEGITPLHSSIISGYMGLMKLIVKYGADINMRTDNKDRYTPLETACLHENIDAVNYLLCMGCDRNDNSIHYAMDSGNVLMLKKFIEYNVDLNRRDAQFNTVLHRSLSDNEIEIAKILIENGADVNAADRNGRTALFFAKMRGNRMLARRLINHGADTSVVDNEGISVKDLDNEEIRSRLYEELQIREENYG